MDRRSGLEADHKNIGWQFDNTYSRLPEVFFASAQPAKVRAPRLSILNHRLADELGLNFGVISPHAAAASASSAVRSLELLSANTTSISPR